MDHRLHPRASSHDGAARRWPALLLALVCLLAPPRPASAQGGSPNPTAAVALSQSSIELGDSIIYQLTIDGVSEVDPPALPESDAWKAEFIGGQDQSSRSTLIINGRKTENSSLKYVLQWRITPRKTGSFAIEGFKFPVGGVQVQAPRTVFRVSEAEANPRFRLELESERPEAYVGEPIRMKLVWTLGANVRTATFTGPDGGKEFDVESLDPRPPQQRGSAIQNNEPYRAINFLNGQAVISRSQAEFEGRSVPRFTLDLVVTPRREGELEIGPYRVVCDEIVGQRSRGFFDSPFDDVSQTRRTVVASNALKLKVKPLPEEGRPADFSGLIGRYALEASAGAGEANVGDPVPLTLTISGPEPLTSLKAPDLEGQADFSAQFKAAPEGWEPEGAKGRSTSGSRTFKTTVRPKSDSVSAIPPIRLPYFDTASGKYDVALSKPIPLKVKASRQITAADAQGGSGLGAGMLTLPGGAPVALTDAVPGVGANSESRAALTNQQVNLLTLAASPAGAVFLLAPPATFAAALIVARRRRGADPARAARREALQRARSLLAGAASHAEFSRALRTALAPFLGVAPDALTARDAQASSLPAEAARLAADLLGELESAAYDGVAINLASARPRAQTLLQQLAKA